MTFLWARALTLHADHRLQSGDLAREIGAIGRIDDLGDILVRAGRFLGNTALRWATDQDAASGERIDDLAAAPVTGCLVPAHAASRAVARGAERGAHSARGPGEDVRRRPHAAAAQHRLTR